MIISVVNIYETNIVTVFYRITSKVATCYTSIYWCHISSRGIYELARTGMHEYQIEDLAKPHELDSIYSFRFVRWSELIS